MGKKIEPLYSHLCVHKDFQETLEELRKKNILIPPDSTKVDWGVADEKISPDTGIISFAGPSP